MLSRKLGRVWREETAGWQPRVWLANALPGLLPIGMGGRLRGRLYRACGMRVGAGTIIAGPLRLGVSAGAVGRIRIGKRCFINSHVYADAAAPILLGDDVSLGHHVVIVTTDHVIGPPERRAGALRTAAVTVGDGAWIAAGVTLLPGVAVGAGAIVAAGAVVTRDVPPHALAGGVPARVIRFLDTPRPPAPDSP